MRKKLLLLSLCLVLTCGFVFSQDNRSIVSSQQPAVRSNQSSEPTANCQLPTANSSYDPIAAALDSLVNLSYIQKLSFSSSQPNNNYKPYEIPSYSDEVYSKR